MKFLFDHFLLIVLGIVVLYAIFDIYRQSASQESDLLTEEPPFKCSTRKYKVLELEAIHKQRVVASFEHRGALLGTARESRSRLRRILITVDTAHETQFP